MESRLAACRQRDAVRGWTGVARLGRGSKALAAVLLLLGVFLVACAALPGNPSEKVPETAPPTVEPVATVERRDVPREPSSRDGRTPAEPERRPQDALASPAGLPAATPPSEQAARVVHYRVEKGDTILGIAAKFGVSPETVVWANKWEEAPDHIAIGEMLTFPSVSGVLHEIQPGDTVAGLAQRYLADGDAIVAANQLNPAALLVIGRQLIVPGGQMVARASKEASRATERTATKPASPTTRGGAVPGTLDAATPTALSPKDAGTSAAAPVVTPVPSGQHTNTGAGSVVGDVGGAGGGSPAIKVQVSTAIDPNPAHWAFIQAAIDPARASRRETGVPASVAIGQAIHESNWGASRLSREGQNYFGIKATSKPGPRGVISLNTWEVIGGSDVTVRDGFRAYNNMAESFQDHGRFFIENSRYAKAMAKKNDPIEFLRLIAEAGYATDPAYVRKVRAYMDKYDLYQYDR